MEKVMHKVVERIYSVDGNIIEFKWTSDDYNMIENYFESRSINEVESIEIDGKRVPFDLADETILAWEKAIERTSHKVGDVVTIAVTGSHKKGDEYVIVEVRGGGSNYVATLKGCKPYDPICTTTIGADEL